MNLRKSFLITFAVALGLLAATDVLAWTGPTASPPGSNASAPVNISGTGQIKSGSITASGLSASGAIVSSGTVWSPQYCFAGGTNCISAWPSGGGGTLTGSGSTNFLPKFTSSTALGNSLIFDNGTNVGIGTAAQAPVSRLQVMGPVGSGTTLTVGNPNVTNSASSVGAINIYGEYQGTVYLGSISQGSTNMFITAGGGAGSVLFGSNVETFNGKQLLTLDPSNAKSLAMGHDGTNAVFTTSSGNFTFNSRIINTTAYNANTNLGGYDVGVGTIGAGTSIYSYGSMCVGNSSGVCTGSGGVVITAASVTAPAFYYNSDARLKKNVEAIASSKALQDILALQPVTYNWIDPAQPTTTQLGFIAQQVEQVVPEIVSTNASTTLKSVDYARVTPLLVGAAQAQQAQIDAQQKEIDALEAEVAALKAGQ